MDQPQYSSLLAALAHVPDPRCARGKQLEWTMILGVIASALLSGQRGAAAIAQWADRQRRPLLRALRPHVGVCRVSRPCGAPCTASTSSRWNGTSPPSRPPRPQRRQPEAPRGHAIDGKHVRGAGAHGQPTVLVSLVAHRDAQVVAQTAVAHKRHESQAVPVVLEGRDLRGMVITHGCRLDASHAGAADPGPRRRLFDGGQAQPAPAVRRTGLVL